MTQKSYAEGLRALYLYTATFQDAAVAEAVHGVDAKLAGKINDLLLPIVKGVGSEQAYAKLAESLQTLGGSGFLQDHPIEQYIRDAKIDSLYEGTTAIQSLDFFFRKIVKDNGVALAHVAGEIEEFVDSESGNGRLEGRARAAGQGAGRCPGDGGHADRLPDGGAARRHQPLQGGPGFWCASWMSVGDLVYRLVAAASGRGGRRGARRRRQRRRTVLLRRQDRHRVVLREEHPAAADQHPRGGRDVHGQRHHGTRRGGLLDPPSHNLGRTTKDPPLPR